MFSHQKESILLETNQESRFNLTLLPNFIKKSRLRRKEIQPTNQHKNVLIHARKQLQTYATKLISPFLYIKACIAPNFICYIIQKQTCYHYFYLIFSSSPSSPPHPKSTLEHLQSSPLTPKTPPQRPKSTATNCTNSKSSAAQSRAAPSTAFRSSRDIYTDSDT